MADVHLAAKVDQLQRERTAQLDDIQLVHVLPVYRDDDDPLQFREYFYPDEQVQLRSANFEQLGHYRRPTNVAFSDDADLEVFLRTMPAAADSSHAEDRPPVSEELFLSDPREYDNCMAATRYAAPLTRRQRHLLRNLGAYVFAPGDSLQQHWRKVGHRQLLIRGYLKELKRRRYARRFRRWGEVRALGLDVYGETLALLEAELADKELLRPHYYADDEPSEFKTLLLRNRKTAIKRRMRQYSSDPRWRRSYRNHIYHAVNRTPPADDSAHMTGNVVLTTDPRLRPADLLQNAGSFDVGDDEEDVHGMSVVNIAEDGRDEEEQDIDGSTISGEGDGYEEYEEFGEEGSEVDYVDGEVSEPSAAPRSRWPAAEQPSDAVPQWAHTLQTQLKWSPTGGNPALPPLPLWARRDPQQQLTLAEADVDEEDAEDDDAAVGVDLEATASFQSFDDDNIPSSEAEWMSDCDESPTTPGFRRPLTGHKAELFARLVDCEPGQRQQLIRSYHVSLIKRRRRQAIDRLEAVLGENRSAEGQAVALRERELADKLLNRGYYYEPGEPREYLKLLFKRRQAIKEKFSRYASDPEFQERYRERIFTGLERPIEVGDELN